MADWVTKRTPCARTGCDGQVRRCESRYCSRKCGFAARVASRQRSKAVNTRLFVKPLPKKKPAKAAGATAGDSWWCDSLAFYRNAALRFPADAGDKSHVSPKTWGADCTDKWRTA
jgi:hypothetical protein